MLPSGTHKSASLEQTPWLILPEHQGHIKKVFWHCHHGLGESRGDEGAGEQLSPVGIELAP